MPRGPRLDAPGAFHHVFARGVAQCDIFVDDLDRRRFLSTLTELCVETQARCFAWTLMSNHYHLLMETGAAPISRVIHRLNQRHAQQFNARYARVGHLFQNRFKSIVVADEPYLFRLIGYIHLNPVYAGVIGLDELEAYPWTGHAALVGRRANRFQEIDRALALFGESHADARAEMRRFVAGLVDDGASTPPRPPESIDLSRRAQADDRMFGVEALRGRSEFIDEVVGTLTARDVRRQVLRRAGWSVDRLLSRVCERVGAREEDVRGGRRTATASRARAIVAHLALERLGETQAAIARPLGVGTPAVGQCAARGRAQCEAMADCGDEFLNF